MSLTIAQLRSRLASGLAEVLGTKTYRTATGQTATVSALTIDYGDVPQSGGSDWFQVAEAHDGLEVVIRPEISSNFSPRLGGDFTLQHNTEIVLKQWDPSGTVLQARSLLLLELGNLIDTVGPRVPRDGTFNAVEFQTFTLALPSLS